MKKILITGINGQIGKSLLKKLDDLFSSKDEIFLLKHKTPIKLPEDIKLNVRVIENIGTYYDLAVHLAANSDINFCQNPNNWEEVVRQNIDLTRKICEKSDKVIFMSTDYVFDGRLNEGESWKEDEEKHPVNEYGRSKSLAEDIVLSHNGVVLRVETMMGTKNKIIEQAKNAIKGEKYFPFWTNNFIRPSYFPDFYRVLKNVIDKNVSGVYHVSCNGDALSRSEMANIVLNVYKEKGWERTLDSLTSEEAKETKRFVLDTQKTKKELGVEFTDSREAIRQHVLEKI